MLVAAGQLMSCDRSVRWPPRCSLNVLESLCCERWAPDLACAGVPDGELGEEQVVLLHVALLYASLLGWDAVDGHGAPQRHALCLWHLHGTCGIEDVNPLSSKVSSPWRIRYDSEGNTAIATGVYRSCRLPSRIASAGLLALAGNDDGQLE